MLSRKELIARRRAVAAEIELFLANGDAHTIDLVLSVVGLRCNLIADDVASTLSSLHGQGVVTIDFVNNLVRLTASED